MSSEKFDFHTDTDLPIHTVIFSRYTCNDHTKKVIDMSNPQSNLLNNIYATCLVNGKYSIDVNNYGCIGKLLKFNCYCFSDKRFRRKTFCFTKVNSLPDSIARFNEKIVHIFLFLVSFLVYSQIMKCSVIKGAGETGSMYVASYKVRWYVHIYL